MTKPTTFKHLIELSDNFSNEEVCRKYLEFLLWNGKPVCPYCSHDEKIYTLKGGRKYKCSSCRKCFTVTVGTYFEATKIPLKKWFHAIYVFTSHKKGISSHQLAKDIFVTQKSAWFILSRLREILKDKAPFMLTGVTQVDETYVGGKLSNRHQNTRHNKKWSDRFDNKTVVLGLVDSTGKVVSKVLPSSELKYIRPVLEQYIEKGSVMVTDDYNAYRSLPKLGFEHRKVNHSIKEYKNQEGFHTNTVEGWFAQLKRGIFGVYHWTSPQHLQKYCNEFAFRYSTRKLTEADRFDVAVQQSRGRLTYEQLTNTPAPKRETVNKAPKKLNTKNSIIKPNPNIL